MKKKIENMYYIDQKTINREYVLMIWEIIYSIMNFLNKAEFINTKWEEYERNNPQS